MATGRWEAGVALAAPATAAMRKSPVRVPSLAAETVAAHAADRTEVQVTLLADDIGVPPYVCRWTASWSPGLHAERLGSC